MRACVRACVPIVIMSGDQTIPVSVFFYAALQKRTILCICYRGAVNNSLHTLLNLWSGVLLEKTDGRKPNVSNDLLSILESHSLAEGIKKL